MAAFRTIELISRDHDRLKGVHPELAEKGMRLLDALDVLGFPAFVTTALRTEAEQIRLYSQGRTIPGPIVTNADGVVHKSNHQAQSDGYGHAFDLAWLDNPATPQSETYADSMPWELVGAMCKALGLAWGGYWTHPDRPHIELAS